MGIKISRRNFTVSLLFTILYIVFKIPNLAYRKVTSIFYATKTKNYPGRIRKNENFNKPNRNLAG